LMWSVALHHVPLSLSGDCQHGSPALSQIPFADPVVSLILRFAFLFEKSHMKSLLTAGRVALCFV